jgi:cyanophycin synthetase
VRKEEDAMAAAQAVGFPLVVKPNSGNMGRAVSIGVRDEAELRAAVRRAQAISTEVVIEALIPAGEYRLLVVGGRFVAASHRRPAQVRGDGSATVRELVEKVNTHPERERLLSGARARRKPLVLDATRWRCWVSRGCRRTRCPTRARPCCCAAVQHLAGRRLGRRD